jgi:hypothetical protein
MNDIKLIIPSAGRSDCVSTTKYILNCILCVPESELDEYKKSNDCKIVTHPDTIKGLGRKRNWILENFKSVVMLDDDLKGMRRLYIKGSNDIVMPSDAYQIIQETYFAARDSGAKLFGFNHVVNPLMYKSLQPIKLTGYINGCCIGIIENDKLKFHEDIIGVNDFYISLLNAYYFRYIYKDSRFCLIQDSIRKNTGGLAKFRNEDTEKKDYLLLKKYFGEAIKLKTSNKQTTNTLKYGRTINLPF